MTYVEVFAPTSQFDAQVISDLLEAAGIPCIVSGPNLSVAITGSSWALPGTGEIVVNPEDAERALELIAGFRGTLGELAEVEIDSDNPEGLPDDPA